ncbi:hypothetical protein HPP92_028518, partial [Vanilla planifolia]
SPRDFVQFIGWSPSLALDPVHHVRDISTWQCEHEWKQDLAVVTKWLSGNGTARYANFLCVCSVFSSGSIQLHWAQWPPPENSEPRK